MSEIKEREKKNLKNALEHLKNLMFIFKREMDPSTATGKMLSEYEFFQSMKKISFDEKEKENIKRYSQFYPWIYSRLRDFEHPLFVFEHNDDGLLIVTETRVVKFSFEYSNYSDKRNKKIEYMTTAEMNQLLYRKYGEITFVSETDKKLKLTLSARGHSNLFSLLTYFWIHSMIVYPLEIVDLDEKDKADKIEKENTAQIAKALKSKIRSISPSQSSFNYIDKHGLDNILQKVAKTYRSSAKISLAIPTTLSNGGFYTEYLLLVIDGMLYFYALFRDNDLYTSCKVSEIQEISKYKANKNSSIVSSYTYYNLDLPKTNISFHVYRSGDAINYSDREKYYERFEKYVLSNVAAEKTSGFHRYDF